MLFNSLAFLAFFPIVTILYFLTPHRWRWLLLLAASCVFYMAFIPVYILILVFTIVIDYFAGLGIAGATGARRRLFLVMSIVANVGVLAVFKYVDFFAANVNAIARAVDWNYSFAALSIVLPIGLSFHTFQAMSYTIEVYRGRVEPERHFGIYALYVMFYPQLVAGPIERPQHLQPQFHEPHHFDDARVANGLKLMLWGFFKKIVIADRLAPVVANVYGDTARATPAALVAATLAFTFQIYCDFSGYSDIARGAAQVMGFELMVNFRRPYAARSIQEFWRRWHISLSTWFRDYVYFPLGGNRRGALRTAMNIMIVFLLSGLWHGANWTFVVWGALHGAALVAQTALSGRRLPAFISWALTFSFVSFAWIFFRAASVDEAMRIVMLIPRGLHDLVRTPLAALMNQCGADASTLVGVVSIGIMEIVQWFQERGSVRQMLATRPMWLRWSLYYAATAWVLLFGKLEVAQFIYFQF